MRHPAPARTPARARRSPTGSGSQRRAAFTIIEMMLVVSVMALAGAGAVYSFQALNKTQVKSACMRVLAAARFAYGRSITRGTTVRLVLNFEDHSLAVEEAEGAVTIVGVGQRQSTTAVSEDDDSVVSPWEAAQARLKAALEPTAFISPFSTVRGRDGEVLKKYSAEPFGSGVRVHKMLLTHRPEPRTSGKEAVYFFPGGMNERAVVQLRGGEGLDAPVYTVELLPLSGNGRVYPYAYEPRHLTESDVEDPG